MFNHHDITRDACMLRGPLARNGYDWWWHSFTAQDAQTGEDKAFFVEFFLINPALADENHDDQPILGQLPANKAAGKHPSYLMVKAGTWGEDHAQLHRFFAWKDVQIGDGKKRRDSGALFTDKSAGLQESGLPEGIEAASEQISRFSAKIEGELHKGDLPASVPYRVEAADCLASETQLRGSIHISPEEAAAHPEWMCDAGSMQWDLTIDKQIAFNVGYGASKPLRDAEAFAMYWHAEGMKSAYQGTVFWNGRKYTVTPEKSYGYADKNWGSDFTTPWLWLSSNCLISKTTGKRLENSVFDIGGGRPKIYFVPLDRRLLGVFYYEGEEYDFNFSKLHLQVRTTFSFEEQKDQVVWHVFQENIHAAMETAVTCQKKDMLLINYEAPDGSKRHNRLWNGGNGVGTVKLYDKKEGRLVLKDEVWATHIGCEYGEYDPE